MNWIKICSLSLALFMIHAFFLPLSTKADSTATLNPSEFTAESMLLMDLNTEQILYAHNEDKILYPASTTKIVTGLLALESGQLYDHVVTSERARHAKGSRIYLEEGEEKPLIDLVHGLLINSGNDAAIAIAEHLAGSVEEFAVEMNKKAKELGATHTHFVNPNGLHDEDHYTTALDLARIAKGAMEDPLFRQIVTTQEMPWFGDEWHSKLVNTNQLLNEYQGITGVKTGYTRQAKQTFVVTAERNGTELLAVLMKTKNRETLWEEATQFLDYGFANYETRKIKEKGDMFTTSFNGMKWEVELADDIEITVNKNSTEPSWTEEIQFQRFPKSHGGIEPGTEVANLDIILDEKTVATTDLLLYDQTFFTEEYRELVHNTIGYTPPINYHSNEPEYNLSAIVGHYWYIPLCLLLMGSWLVRTIVKRKKEAQYNNGAFFR